MSLKKIPVLVFTDRGDDIDDDLALLYLLSSDVVEIVGVIANHKRPLEKALIGRELFSFLSKGIMVAPGSSVALKADKTDWRFVKYNHRYLSSELLIKHCLEKYQDDLVVLAIGPMTDLAKAIHLFPEEINRVKAIFIQGQIVMESEIIKPDPQAYNCHEDMLAAQMVFDLQIPTYCLTKHAASAVLFYNQELQPLFHLNNLVSRFIKKEMFRCLGRYQREDEVKFRKFFKIPDHMSSDEFMESDLMFLKMYDVLTAMLIEDLSCFQIACFQHVGVIGLSSQDSGIINKEKIKKLVLQRLYSIMSKSI